MSNRQSRVLLAVAALLSGGCEGGPRPSDVPIERMQYEDSVNLPLIEAVPPIMLRGDSGMAEANDGSPAELLTLEMSWRLGGAEATGPEIFGAARAVSIGPHGHVYILDGQTSEITVFDATGQFARRFGGYGDGPGEFRDPQSMAWSPQDELWVADLRGRYTVFDSLGEVIRTLPRAVACVHRRPSLGVFDGDGFFIDERCISPEDGVSFYRVDAFGNVTETFPAVHAPAVDLRANPDPMAISAIAGLRTGTQAALMHLAEFRPRLLYRVRDSRIWLAESHSWRVIERDLRGDTLRVLRMNHREAVGLSLEQDRLIDQTMRSGGLEREDFAYGHQVLAGIQVLETGHLLLQINQSGVDGTLFDILTLEGRVLGSSYVDLRLDPDPPIASRGDTIVAIGRDEFDVGVIVRFVIRGLSG